MHVDPELCQGNGVCVGRAGKVFDLGDDEIAVVLVDEVPEDQDAAVRDAAASCPTQAITVDVS
ncbi:MAG: ferredoxin [Pseudonocardia sp. SCN 72-86]|nr:MAG: ferredoxin [Pseudonocardia sp. SCN 72-86]